MYLSRAPIGVWTIAYIGEEGGDNNISIVGQGSQGAPAVNAVFVCSAS